MRISDWSSDVCSSDLAIDPNAAKRQARIEASIRANNSFASVAEELIEKKTREGLAEPTLAKMRWFVKLLGGDFGKRPITEITPQELLHELRKHERRGRFETANLLRAFASRVFRYGDRKSTRLNSSH